MVIETYRKFKLLGDRVEDVLYTETRVYEDLRPSKLEDFTIIQLWQTSTRTHEIVKYDASHGPCHVHKFYEGQAIQEDFRVKEVNWGSYQMAKNEVLEKWREFKDKYLKKHY
ncbi:MAG TPA: hypothetical protein VFF13_05455 [archaeon]|nr:hypothetical protein [archaeon]